MAGIGEEWSICHSNIAAAKLVMSCFPTNSTTPDRLVRTVRDQNGRKYGNLPTLGDHRPNRQCDEHPVCMGRRCPLTPTDPPGSIAAEFNDRVTKGVDPTAAFLS